MTNISKALNTSDKKRLAIIGSGISGLSAAYILKDAYDVVLYEKASAPGGHARTLSVEYNGRSIAVDTGFIVYNERNYPHLVSFFHHLGITTKPAGMSFGASLDNGRIEWGANSLNACFGQRANLFRPSMWKGLYDVLRFNRGSEALVESNPDLTLGELLNVLGAGRWFRESYLLPMGAAIWSCPAEQMLAFPAASFVRFFKNHGLLTVNDQPQWRTVEGGSRVYVARVVSALANMLRVNREVIRVLRRDDGIEITDCTGETERYDKLLFACHADEVLGLLGDADAQEHEALKRFAYQKNVAVLHRDAAQMPRRRLCWSSWNYLADTARPVPAVSVTYWMNALQSLPKEAPLFVTLNPLTSIDPALVFDTHVFHHPVYTQDTLKGQQALGELQSHRKTWYCGAHMGFGFHEDGIRSAVEAAAMLGVRPPWS